MDKSHEIRTGVFYNGDPNEVTSAEWNAHAIERYHTVEEDLHIEPDTAVFATWMRWPEKALPEEDPSTLSYLVRSYIQDRDRRNH